MAHVSIIVVNYNSSDFTNKCLESLAKTIKKNFKFDVLIVDNGSREKYQVPSRYQNFVTLLRSESNLGFTGGNNAGIQHAIETFDSEFVFLLNNDTLIDSKALKFLVEHIQSDSKIGAVSPKIYFGPGSEFHIDNYRKEDRGNVLWYAGGSIDWQHLAAFHRGVDEIDRGQFDSQNSSDFATGCAVLIRRELLEKIGGFDERFFLYFEDVDLSLNIASAGYQLSFDPRAKVWHFNASSSGGSGSELHNYYQTRNRLLLAFTHGSWQSWLTSMRIMMQIIFDNKDKSNTKRTAVFHALTNNFGKKLLG